MNFSTEGQFKGRKESVLLGWHLPALEGFDEEIVSLVKLPQTGHSLHMAKLARRTRT